MGAENPQKIDKKEEKNAKSLFVTKYLSFYFSIKYLSFCFSSKYLSFCFSSIADTKIIINLCFDLY